MVNIVWNCIFLDDKNLKNNSVKVSVPNHASRPKNKRRCCYSCTWFIYILQMRKKICTVLYSNIKRTVILCGACKYEQYLIWDGGHQCKVQTSLRSWFLFFFKPTDSSPNAIELTPSPSSPCFNPTHPHMRQNFTKGRWHQHTGRLLHLTQLHFLKNSEQLFLKKIFQEIFEL